MFLTGEHGAGLTNLQYASLAEISGRSIQLAPAAMNCAAPDTGNMEVLAQFGTPEQRAQWLRPLLDGEIRSAFAMTKPDVASSDATNIATRITRNGDHYVVDGHKRWISGAMNPDAKFLVVMGCSAPNGPRHRRHSMILVPHIWSHLDSDRAPAPGAISSGQQRSASRSLVQVAARPRYSNLRKPQEHQREKVPMTSAKSAARPASKAEQRKASTDALMSFARHQFVTKGYDATGVEEIAAGVGLTKGAVYFYFKNKVNLLTALIDEAERIVVDPAVEAVDRTTGSAPDQLVAFLHAQSRAGQESAEWMMLLILMSVELHGRGGKAEQRLDAINGRMKKTLTAIVQAGKREGTITKDVPTRELVTAIYAINQGCFLEWYRHGEQLNGPALVRALRTIVLRGVLTER